MKKVHNGRGRVKLAVDSGRIVSYYLALIQTFSRHVDIAKCVSKLGTVRYLLHNICNSQDRTSLHF